jgi:hypothetical protein
MPKAKHSEYGEIKKSLTLSITSTGVKKLREMAQDWKISQSELVERIARRIIPVAVSEAQQLGESYAN